MQEESRAAEHQETEWQLEAPERGAVESWLGSRGEGKDEFSVGEGRRQEISDRYYDTADWRMWRAGYALRIRELNGVAEATMKALAKPGTPGGLKVRREISEPLESADPGALRASEGPVGWRLHALAGKEKLKELFEVRTSRVSHTISGPPEVSLGELALDETLIPSASGEPVEINRVEVEAAGGEAEALQPFVEELREECGLGPSVESKFGSGLRARGLQPPVEPDLGPTQVDDSLTLGEVAYAVMRRQFAKFLLHEPGVRLGEEPEELHDMRVASRRLRSAFQSFEAALPAREQRFEPELKHLAAVLGEVRDLDVQLEQLDEWLSGAPEEDRAPLEELREALLERRRTARERMLSELDSQRYERLVDTLSRMLRLGPSRRNRLARAPVAEAAPDLVRHSYRRVRKTGDEIGPGSPPDEYHKLRKRGKRLRYLLEFLEGVYGKPSRKLVKRIKTLQDVLGEMQDAEAAKSQLRSLAASGEVSSEAAFVMGSVAARYEDEAAAGRERFPGAYSRIKGKKYKKLEKTLRKLREERAPENGS